MAKIVEEELETYLFNNPEYLGTIYSRQKSLLMRQVNLGEYGRADLVYLEPEEVESLERDRRVLCLHVYELKKGEVDVNTLLQASRYAVGLRRVINKACPEYVCEVHLHLFGLSIKTRDDFIFLCNFVENLHLYTYEISLDTGISFTEEHPHLWKMKHDTHSPSKKVREVLGIVEKRFDEFFDRQASEEDE